MADDAPNRLDVRDRSAAGTAGDLPAALLRRYLRERQGSELAYFVDATVSQPAFKDSGRRLSARRDDPNVIRDLVAIAAHRGWREVAVRGTTAFRREAWLAARAAGLEVRGYTPSERDAQLLERRTSRPRDRDAGPQRKPDAAIAPLRIVEAVVRRRIVDPAVQARLIDQARAQLSRLVTRRRDSVERARGR